MLAKVSRAAGYTWPTNCISSPSVIWLPAWCAVTSGSLQSPQSEIDAKSARTDNVEAYKVRYLLFSAHHRVKQNFTVCKVSALTESGGLT